MDNTKTEQLESYIIGYLLSNKNSILIAGEYISEKDFYNTTYSRIYRCVYDLYLAGRDPELIIIADMLKAEIPVIYTMLVDAIENESYVTEESFIDCLEKVKKYSLLRDLQKWNYKNYEQTQNLKIENIDDYILTLVGEAFQYTEKLKKKKNPAHTEIISEIMSDIDKDYVRNIRVGGKLGESIPGLFPGHFWIVGGYSSTGKSFFLNQMIIDIYTNGGKVLLFSLEDSRKEKLIKIISNLSKTHQTEIITNSIVRRPSKIEEIKKVMNDINPWEFFIYDDCFNLQEIKMKIKKHVLQNKIDIVCIDFIQNIKAQGSLYEKMSAAALELQIMARELQVTLIVLSQISNDGLNNPELIGLKGAGELVAAADVILWLRRFKEPERKNWLDCDIRKNRPFGITGTIAYEFSANWSSLEERDTNGEQNNPVKSRKDIYQ